MKKINEHIPEFLQASDRFDFINFLGSGGMGFVYEVFDRERNHAVALKTLRHLNASSLYRFKKEFRNLADIHHPNLIRLYELISDRGIWFFTMELIIGTKEERNGYNWSIRSHRHTW